MVQLLLDIKEPAVSFSYAVLHDFHAAEDAYQEAVAVVVRKADRFEGEGFHAWFWTILRNVVGTRIRALKRNTTLIDSTVLEHMQAHFVDDKARGEDVEHLVECLKRLSGTARKIMEWRFLEGISCAEIAGRVGRTIQSTYSALKRTRVILRECVRRRKEQEESRSSLA